MKALVISHHEAHWRSKAASNYKLDFFNVPTIGYRKPNPILSWVQTTRDTIIIRPQIKMLAGDYACFRILGKERGIETHCRLCITPDEDIVHILTGCRGTSEARNRV